MPDVQERVRQVRERHPLLDHVISMQEHYTAVRGGTLAGAVTYFGFLSVFPLLLLAFAVIGLVSGAFPDAKDVLVDAINQVLPGMVGGENGLDLADIEKAAPSIAGIGVLTVLYSGLGWLRGMRDALQGAFEIEQDEAPGFAKAQLLDLLSLVMIGLVLLLSVAVSGVLARLAEPILEALQLGPGVKPLVWVLAVAIGLGANSVLFWCLFRILANPDIPARSLWSGALLGAVGFELLKQLSSFLLASTSKQPAFQAFGIALVLVVWINYFSRVVIYAASWAYTTEESVAYRAEQEAATGRVEGPQLNLAAASATPGAYAPHKRAADDQLQPSAVFALGAGAMLAVVAFLRRLGRS